MNFSNLFLASFFFSFLLLLKRDWRLFWRDRMKFGSTIINSITRFLLIAILFMNTIPERIYFVFDPVKIFIGVQGLAFLCVASTVMPAIFAVALVSISFIT